MAAERALLAIPDHGDGDRGAGFPGDRATGVHVGGHGNAVYGNDPVAGLKPRLHSGGVGKDGEDQVAVVKSIFHRGADAHHFLAVYRLVKGLILLRVHVIGVGIAQGSQNFVQGVQL